MELFYFIIKDELIVNLVNFSWILNYFYFYDIFNLILILLLLIHHQSYYIPNLNNTIENVFKYDKELSFKFIKSHFIHQQFN